MGVGSGPQQLRQRMALRRPDDMAMRMGSLNEAPFPQIEMVRLIHRWLWIDAQVAAQFHKKKHLI